MLYVVRQFGPLLLTDFKEPGQQDNLGTGNALVNFQPLPNGQFFNFYAGRRSPQGIRPITKEGLLVGGGADPAGDLLDQVDALRAYLGEEDKLTVRWRSGQLRWQWATLTDVEIPVGLGQMHYAPVRLSWTTAAQHWYEIYNTPTAWSVGDGSFRLGDGTKKIGQQGWAYVLDASPKAITISHGGNIRATNLKITVTAGSSSITSLTINNTTTGQSITYTGTIAAGDLFILDSGAMDVTNEGADAYTASFTETDVANWISLEKAADNAFTITTVGNATGDATISFEWYDHYA